MSNTRFVNKGLHRGTDYATLNALANYFENGGTIKVVKSPKRPKKGVTVSKVKIARG
jgi:hypothetical protein